MHTINNIHSFSERFNTWSTRHRRALGISMAILMTATFLGNSYVYSPLFAAAAMTLFTVFAALAILSAAGAAQAETVVLVALGMGVGISAGCALAFALH